LLNLYQVAEQMSRMGQHFRQESQARAQMLQLAQQYLNQAQANSSPLTPAAVPLETPLRFTPAWPVTPLADVVEIAPAPPQHCVLATDGSQIAPSHHEIAFCYLINIGRVYLDYGSNTYPLLDAVAQVFYTQEEVYAAQAWGVSPEDWMHYQRTQLEMLRLVELSQEVNNKRQTDGPMLLLVDGSLIYWAWEVLPGAAKEALLTPILQAWQSLQDAKIPIVGYLSASRSRETLNFLRLQACPYDYPHCHQYCPGSTRPPCQIFTGLNDTTLWQTQLNPGQRGPLWQSAARIMADYGDQHIYFCHVHVGSEIVRLEFPQWVATDPILLDQALSLTLAQVEKGYGYPVALAEAHHLAVIRGSDRHRFFALLERELIKAGLTHIGTSPKESRKRHSLA